MSDSSYKAQSRVAYQPSGGGIPSLEGLSFGCLQRIADATEAMSRPFRELVEQSERDRKRRNELVAEVNARDRTIAALRGQVTRLRNRTGVLESELEASRVAVARYAARLDELKAGQKQGTDGATT